jgi:uncharacterized phage-associated protein
MSYDSLAIANYFIKLARTHGEALTPMKVQKLVYFAHGWNLAIHDEPLLNERIQAWKYGPVVPELYRELKDYGSTPIPNPVQVIRFEGAGISVATPQLEDYGSTAATAQLLDRIWAVYGRYSAIQLSNATHAPGSPWDITWQRVSGASHTVIDDKLIREDFLKRAGSTPSASRACDSPGSPSTPISR